MESAIKLVRGWMSAASPAKGEVEFERGWQSLQSFLSTEPQVKLECNYLWLLLARVRQVQPGRLFAESRLSVLQERLCDVSNDDIQKEQGTL
eukprot:11212200-Lingulodinium_polyedra.AAC.1